MAYYMIQVAYSKEAWAALIKKPHNRMERLYAPLDRMEGRVIGSWLSFGDYDLVMILDLPDNAAAAAVAMTFAAGGATKSVKTTPLMTWEEGIQAMETAGRSDYIPPQDV
ncbi:MAG: hypothetical protein KatS3mg060_0092 [Dehalococcoidia bacterium]|nr:MAG: hypothetical protein KatS3mg060_0092 [Dehalococcoidia bacterium]